VEEETRQIPEGSIEKDEGTTVGEAAWGRRWRVVTNKKTLLLGACVVGNLDMAAPVGW